MSPTWSDGITAVQEHACALLLSVTGQRALYLITNCAGT